jgi:hypothetical protein
MSKNVMARIAPGTGEFAAALTLGTDWTLPKERNGKPCFYYWKPALTIGRKATWGRSGEPGQPIEVPPERVDRIIADFKRAAATGYEPPLPDDHRNPTKNYGWVKDARKAEDGSLELLHQFVGEAEKNEALNKKTSICTLEDITDEHGNHYAELIDHNAIIVNPQLNNLGDFTPALAAARGQAIGAVQFEVSAPSLQEPEMDLTKLREAIGADKNVTDDKLIEQAIAKLTEGKTALELSRTKATEADALKTRAEQAEAKLLELSKGEPDPTTLEDRRITAEEVLCGLVERGQCTDGMAKIVRENFIGAEKQPSLMLSRGARSGPVGAVFKLLELNKELKGFRQTDGQPVPRNTPGADDKDKPLTPERKAALLAHVGA